MSSSVRKTVLDILCPNPVRPCKTCQNLADKVLARYDIDGLLDDLSNLNAENHRLLDLVDLYLPKHEEHKTPHSPASSTWCEGCAARGITPLNTQGRK